MLEHRQNFRAGKVTKRYIGRYAVDQGRESGGTSEQKVVELAPFVAEWRTLRPLCFARLWQLGLCFRCWWTGESRWDEWGILHCWSCSVPFHQSRRSCASSPQRRDRSMALRITPVLSVLHDDYKRPRCSPCRSQGIDESHLWLIVYDT